MSGPADWRREMTDLSGRAALVTGGARGQGAAEARLLAECGARVLICDVLEDEGRAVARGRRGSRCDARGHRRGEPCRDR